MQLVAFSVQGYRRFVDKTSIKLHGNLIAIVGPNEAGKSSLLKALAHLNTNEFAHSELPRRSGHKPRLSWILQLEDEDKEAIKRIHDASHIEAIELTKRADGNDIWGFKPRDPKRDISERRAVLELMRKNRDKVIAEAQDVESTDFSAETYDAVVEHLSESGNLDNDQIDTLRTLASTLMMLPTIDPVEGEPVEIHDQVGEAVRDLLANERSDSPWKQCLDALKPRLPRVVLFNEEDRDLLSSYNLAEVADEPPPALAHLAQLAGLDLRQVRDNAVARRQADVATARISANSRLQEIYRESWNQHEIAIQVEIDGTELLVHATTPIDNGLSSISERSDGLRWFAALLAFAHDLPDRPIILVDEIETHLHYDAQADLVDVLSAQQFASKVIYTTHSFGCLPQDLGTGVRVVRPADNGTSKLDNGFWADGSGFTPLLASMGATAFSFTPTRSAVIAEGPADAILLPTLLRQASSEQRIGFQVAPGLSIVSPAAVNGLLSEAGRVGFLTDGDPGGVKIAKKLKDAKIPEELIVTLRDERGNGIEVEDLIDQDIYVGAVNDELSIWNNVQTKLTKRDVPMRLRTKKLEEWCLRNSYNVPDKRAVAERVVDRSEDGPIYMAARRSLINSVLGALRSILDAPRIG